MKKSLFFVFFMLVVLFSAFCAEKQSKTAEFTTAMFKTALPGIQTSMDDVQIYQKGKVEGRDFSFTINLSKWNKNTSVEQIVIISQLFWQTYPAMYKRFGESMFSPEDITLAIEDEGYEVAWAMGSLVHLHDKWLKDNPNDFDCLTHEFSHVIQNNWLENYLEYDGYIERFADYCRFIYAFNDGYYNDNVWTLWTPENEDSRESSVRFLVWLDTFYSTPKNDILLRYAHVARNGHFARDDWDNAWNRIFRGSKLEGKTIDEAWALFVESDFAWLSSYSEEGKKSKLRSQIKR